MHPEPTPPDPTPILKLLNAFRKSKVMYTAVALGLFDALASGAKSRAALATELSCDPDALERLLGGCVMLGLLSRTADGDFANTPTARTYLTSTSDRRFLGYIGVSDRVLWPMWGNLTDAVREGTNRWKQTYGWDEPIFDSFFKDDAARREFLLGMHSFGLISSPQVVNAVDLSKFNTFVDLGGATGHLTTAACRRWPNLRGVIFDLPKAIPLAEEVVKAGDVADRITFVGGDFFTDPLPAGDVYAMGRIVHDWSEEKIVKLLKKICEALPSGGAVLIAEKVLDDDKAGPEWAVLQSLNMLVMTEGKERTFAEYEALLKQAGFAEVSLYTTASPLDAVVGVKG